MSRQYKEALENKDYLSLALYNEFSFWQESMAQDDQSYLDITEDEIWEVIYNTIDDQQLNDEFQSCFDYYLDVVKKK